MASSTADMFTATIDQEIPDLCPIRQISVEESVRIVPYRHNDLCPNGEDGERGVVLQLMFMRGRP